MRHRAVDAVVIGTLLLLFTVEVTAQLSNSRAQALGHLSPLTSAAWEDEHPVIARYVDFVHEFHGNEDWQSELNSIYAEEVFFADSFTTLEDRSGLLRYFQNLRDASQPMRLKVLDVLEGEQGTYLVWQIETEFVFFGSEKKVSSMGGTLFRFDEQGQIVFQKDFWDSTEGFFEHVPLLGALIEAVRERVAA